MGMARDNIGFTGMANYGQRPGMRRLQAPGGVGAEYTVPTMGYTTPLNPPDFSRLPAPSPRAVVNPPRSVYVPKEQESRRAGARADRQGAGGGIEGASVSRQKPKKYR